MDEFTSMDAPENKGLTFEELEEAIKAMPEAPKFSEIHFVENNLLPDNYAIVSKNLMTILKTIFKPKQ